MSRKQPNMNFGAAILFVIFSLLFFVLIFRYFSIQITGEAAGQPLAAKAKQKYMKHGVLEATRGTIFDRTGEVVAEDTTAYTLVAILDKKMTTDPKKPMHVKDPEKTARELSNYIKMDESEIYHRLTNKSAFQVEFGKAGRDISHQTKTKIEALHLPGIIFMRDSKRFYPNGIFASHVVGFVERKEQKDQTYKTEAKMGVEKTEDSKLEGKNGTIDYESDLWGYLLPDSKKKITPAKNGNDVYLTLDKKIQTFLEDALNKVDKEYKPKKMIAIVANPKTGEILAMGQRPTFRPSTREGIDKSWHNEAIETSFEPGSTMKIFTLSAAIQENSFNPNAIYQSGTYKIAKSTIHDHNYVGWGPITYLEGVQRSSNVAFAKIANEQLGFDKLRTYLTKFGFDKPTGIDLPDEASGKILFHWPIEKATTAFGQGTAITPIQQIQAATAVANDGKMMKPHVVEKIVEHDTGKVVQDSAPEIVGNPISAETAKKVRDILGTVVTSPKGTGSRYKIDGYDVAGKTGTAQMPGPDGKYLTGAQNYVFSFLGMAPKDDPKLIVYVAVQQPDIETYFDGSKPVSEIFVPVMKSSLQYLNIQPIKQDKPSTLELTDLTGEQADTAVNTLKDKGFETVVIGNGNNIEGQLPKGGESILEGEKVIIYTGGNAKIPDMTGWSLRDVMKVAKLLEIKLSSAGSGYVEKQSIPAGTEAKNGESLIVKLRSPEQLFEAESQKSDKKKDEKSQKEAKD
ncbi:penicillin-binding protein [Neobacillus terrae]|uniref:penicillin-binding protein n=1 Tax=Neobacillus terrae TaxID=3034837 RepID=UPI00140D2FE7|nr:penicillin-binding protein [Neobacillus terrae]NHM29696.1 penicillin-binding protein [Neobacillus terrae]